jgi:ABC-type glutathione transport system ATPase component
VSFELAAGERLALVAPSGTAAAALARGLAWLERPAAGSVRFEGQDLARLGGGHLRALRRRLQYVSGNARPALAPQLSMAGVLAEPLQLHRLGKPAEQRARVAAAAGAWALNPWLLEENRSALSPALCVRVALARACLLAPSLLVADRLTEFVEPAAARPLLEQLAAYCEAHGMACVLVTTDGTLGTVFAGRVKFVAESGDTVDSMEGSRGHQG